MRDDIAFINKANVKDISTQLLKKNGKLTILNTRDYELFSYEEIRYFCHEYSRYGLPTRELIDYLQLMIGDRTAIEIGAGCGDLGYNLAIPMTDSRMQELPYIRKQYAQLGQPTITYPDDVLKYEALEAIEVFKPQIVIASWVTTHSPIQTLYGSSPYGVKENKILEQVETYILIGNQIIHGDKPIMAYPHKTIIAEFNISRAKYPESNRIYIWNRK